MNNTITGQEVFEKLIMEYGQNRQCLKLLRFFATHPGTRFNRRAVIWAQEDPGREYEVEQALAYLIDQNIVKCTVSNDDCFYFLTGEETRRKWVLALAGLEWRQWQLAFKKAYRQWEGAVNTLAVSPVTV